MLWKRRKIPRLQSIVQHGGRRHPLRATKAMPTPCKAFGWENLPVKCLEGSCHQSYRFHASRFSWRMQRTFNHAQLVPRKNCANAAALPGFKDRRAFGFSRRMQAQTTSSWQTDVLWAAYCLYLQPSAVEKAWTLHLCPVGATADCESVHRSCPRCGSKIHSQQVSVLGQLLDGILSRCIPWRTPVSSGLRSTKTFFKWNVISTHRDFLGVDSCDQKRHTRNPVKLSYLQGRRERVQRTDASRPRPPCPQTYCLQARRSRSWSFGNANRTTQTCGHTLTWKMNDHLEDVTLEHCSTVTSSRSIIFSIKRTATLAQTLAALLTLLGSQKRHTIKEMIVTDATKCHQYG